jgi:hypothetical protein
MVSGTWKCGGQCAIYGLKFKKVNSNSFWIFCYMGCGYPVSFTGNLMKDMTHWLLEKTIRSMIVI